MTKTSKLKTSQHVVFVPVYGLELTKAVRGELQVGRVTFMDAKKIPRVRKRLGLKHAVSHYRPQGILGARLLREAPAYACLKTTRDPKSPDYSAELGVVREAFWLLASSFFTTTWRKDAALSLRLKLFLGGIEDVSIFECATDAYRLNLKRRYPLEPNRLDDNWKRISRYYHFFDLMRIMNGSKQVNAKWKKALVRSSVLAGQSFLARHVSEAFLNDMIAIETLLAERGDKSPDTLIRRVLALFGWMTGEDPARWSTLVERLYQLRCSYVHDGHSGDISGMDLFEADTLLQNLLLNLCKNTRYITSKRDIIELADQLDARKTLGLKPRRPGKLTHLRTRLTPSVQRNIDDTGAWAS